LIFTGLSALSRHLPLSTTYQLFFIKYTREQKFIFQSFVPAKTAGFVGSKLVFL